MTSSEIDRVRKFTAGVLVGALAFSVLVAGVFAQPPQRQAAPKGPWMDKSLPPDQRAEPWSSSR